MCILKRVLEAKLRGSRYEQGYLVHTSPSNNAGPYCELGVAVIVNRFDVVLWLSLQRWLCASYILLQVMLREYNTIHAHSSTCAC